MWRFLVSYSKETQNKTKEMTENTLYNKNEDNLSNANYEINLNNGFCKKGETSRMHRFKNKFAVVTGASGNFGEICAEKLAEEGCNVILWDLKSTETLKNFLKKRYPNQLFESHQFNICNEQEVIILDTRNDYEVRVGTFKNAIDLKIPSFRDFPDAVSKLPEDYKKKQIVTFFTHYLKKIIEKQIIFWLI